MKDLQDIDNPLTCPPLKDTVADSVMGIFFNVLQATGDFLLGEGLCLTNTGGKGSACSGHRYTTQSIESAGSVALF